MLVIFLLFCFFVINLAPDSASAASVDIYLSKSEMNTASANFSTNPLPFYLIIYVLFCLIFLCHNLFFFD